jgi:hypothetical protein
MYSHTCTVVHSGCECGCTCLHAGLDVNGANQSILSDTKRDLNKGRLPDASGYLTRAKLLCQTLLHHGRAGQQQVGRQAVGVSLGSVVHGVRVMSGDTASQAGVLRTLALC